MAKYLFIIESPGKQKKIQSFLGKDYLVIPTYGHIRDLPPKKIGVKVKKDFEATYEVYPEKRDVVRKIQREANKADVVYLATDLDREGSGIAWGVSEIIPEGVECKRVVYNSITKDEILNAVDNAGSIDMDAVHSYETRRILDRLVGWKTSFPTKQATGGNSAGRVQSAALRIIAEREKEIRDFVPKEYWQIDAKLSKNGETFKSTIKKPKSLNVNSIEEANQIEELMKNNKWIVSKYSSKDKRTKAYSPFTTSTMYQSAASLFNWSNKKTASVAQSLYDEGRCTYIRTDSPYIVPDFINQVRSDISSSYGCNYIPSSANVFTSKSGAQEAHEAIRPTDISDMNFSGNSDNSKLYELIWKRTFSSQMSNMVQNVRNAEIKCSDCIFSSSGSKIEFDGWTKVWTYGSYNDEEIPELEEGEEVKLESYSIDKKYTQPPNRFTESSLTKELEKRGIGRPSTYASIPQTLNDRKYIEYRNRALFATDLGIRVSDFLVDANFCFSDLDFSKNLEDDLDKIANNEINKLDVLNCFWNRLSSDLENSKKIKEERSKTEYKCPDCDGFLLKKFSNYGPFFTCENRTNKENPCNYKCQMNEDGSPKENEDTPEPSYSDICCPNCGEEFVIRTSKKGNEYLSCRNWKDSKCKGFYTMEGEKMEFKKKKKFWKKKKKND